MKRNTPDEEAVKDVRRRGGTQRLYNEEMARQAVGSLFDDENEDTGEDTYDEEAADDYYVTGYNTAASGSSGKRRAVPPENPAEYEEVFDDADDYAEASPRSTSKPVGTSRAAYDDADDHAATADEMTKPSRTKESTPRPAVKVNITVPASGSASGHTPHPRPATQSSRSRTTAKPVHTMREENYPEDEDLSSFRQRYRGRDSVPAAKAEEEPRRPRKTTHVAAPRDDDGGFNTSPVRWVAATLTFIFLVVLVILVYRINVVTGELREAKLQLDNAPSNETEVAGMLFRIEELENQVEDLRLENTDLLAELALYKPAQNVTQPNNGGDTTPTPQPTTAPDNLPTTYTVVSGDNLTKIARLFYNDTSPASIEKIMQANNLPNDNIAIGQKLIIP